jgi:antitoxin VapB
MMRTVSIFKNGNNRAIRLPRDLDFEGVSELEIVREGDSIILRPVRPTWGSFAQFEKADPDFMAEREDVVSDEGRFNLCETRPICSTPVSARSSCASSRKPS